MDDHGHRDLGVNDDGLQRLSGRQQEVLALMAEGRTNASIARKLFKIRYLAR